MRRDGLASVTTVMGRRRSKIVIRLTRDDTGPRNGGAETTSTADRPVMATQIMAIRMLMSVVGSPYTASPDAVFQTA